MRTIVFIGYVGLMPPGWTNTREPASWTTSQLRAPLLSGHGSRTLHLHVLIVCMLYKLGFAAGKSLRMYAIDNKGPGGMTGYDP